MSFDLVITGGTAVTPDGLRAADLAISAGRIAAILAPGTAVQAGARIDAAGLHILPGVIDIHAHIRSPAYPERGGVASETAAAAAGGMTTIFEMPITLPCCNSPEEVVRRRDHFAEHAHIDFALFAAPGTLSESAFDALAAEGIIALKMFTTPAPPGRDDEFAGLARPGSGEQREVLRLAARFGLPVVVHAENAGLLAAAEAALHGVDPGLATTHGAARPAMAEAAAVALLLTLNIEAGAKLHIAHVTSSLTVDVLRRFRGSSDFTAETCPHYLRYTDDDVARVGVFGKINPPIRQAADREALWGALADGTLAHVTTDHAGFTAAEKLAHAGNFLTAPPGHPGTEALLPVMLDAAASGRLALSDVARLTAGNAARRFGLPDKGAIAPGKAADLVLVDMDGETRITEDSLLTAAGAAGKLHHGQRFQGRICTTLLAGEPVWQDGAIIGAPGQGRYARPERGRHGA